MSIPTLKKDSRFGSLFFAFLFLLPSFLSLGQTSKTVSIIGVGDMMLGTNYPSKKYLPPNGGLDLLGDVREILNSADVNGFFGVDDFRFENAAAAVPEPASIAMWGLGALGLVFVGRKRRQLMTAA